MHFEREKNKEVYSINLEFDGWLSWALPLAFYTFGCKCDGYFVFVLRFLCFSFTIEYNDYGQSIGFKELKERLGVDE